MDTIVSLTTLPSRINNIHHIVRTILSQTFLPDEIVLYLPERCNRTNELYVIPEELIELEKTNWKFNIRRVQKDMGPGTKWYYAMKEGYKKIISFDDDVLIHQQSIEELLKSHKKFPTEALGFMGTIDGKFVHSEHLTNIEKYPVSLLGGYRSVLFPWGNFTYEMKQKFIDAFETLCEEKPVVDDDYFLSKAWKHFGVTCSVIPTLFHWKFFFLDWGNVDGVNHETNTENMEQDRKRIDQFFSYYI